MTTWLRATEALLLGGWFGSWALFALVIAPTAFRELPSGEIAGQLVGPVLRVLHYYGIVALFLNAGPASGTERACPRFGETRGGLPPAYLARRAGLRVGPVPTRRDRLVYQKAVDQPESRFAAP